MVESDIKKPYPKAKAFAMLLAGFVAVASLVLVAITHEPRPASSNPSPAAAAIVPQIADAKSEAEIFLRGKSFVFNKRNVVTTFGGEFTEISVSEGELVKEGELLAKYTLDRPSVLKVRQVLYPANVINLKQAVRDQQGSVQQLTNVTLPIKKIELQNAEKAFEDARSLHAKSLAPEEMVKRSRQRVESLKKEIRQYQDGIKRAQKTVVKTQGDVKFHEDLQKRNLDLLQWQTKRSFSDSELPIDRAFLKAPINGRIVWISPMARKSAVFPGGFRAMVLAEMAPILIRCKVHELDLVKLRTGDKGMVTFDAVPDKQYACKINRIAWVSRNPALEVPADYDIECMLDQPDDRIKEGLTCNVKISVTQ
jgi:multidrug resistance efflux pump